VEQNEEIKTKLTDIKNIEDEMKNKVAEVKVLNEDIKNQVISLKQDFDTKTSAILNAIAGIQQQLSNEMTQIRNQAPTTKNEITCQTSGIQQQLVVQSNGQNSNTQAINPLKITITEKFDNPVQKSILQQSTSTQDIVINGSSSLITSLHFNMLKEWIPKPPSLSNLRTCRLDLLYKGSRDGFTAQKFHDNCESKSPTISFIKSQTYGRIFGGYTEHLWNQTTNYLKEDDKNQTTNYLKEDDNAFLFSLTHNEKYPVVVSKSAIYVYYGYSVMYGDNFPDILIQNDCDRVNNQSYFPRSYKCPKFTQETEESKAYLAGSHDFKVEEIEVYQVLWI